MKISTSELVQAIRSELTSGDPKARKLLADLALSAILKDSAGAELSSYVKNLDTKLSDFKTALLSAVLKDSAGAELSDYVKKLQNLDAALSNVLPSGPTAAGNFRAALLETNIKQPIDVQDHWQESVELAASAARTASGNTADIDVGRFLYGEICLDVTAVSGTTPTLDVYIEGKDQVSGKYKVLFSQTGINAVGTYWFTLTMNAWKYLRVRWVIGGTSPSFTFSVGLEGKS